MKIPLSNLHLYRCDRRGELKTATPHYTDVSAPATVREQTNAVRDQWQQKQSVRDRFKWHWTCRLGFAMTMNVPNPLRVQGQPALPAARPPQDDMLELRRDSDPRVQQVRQTSSSERAPNPVEASTFQDNRGAALTLARAMRNSTARSVYDRLKHPVDYEITDRTVPVLSRQNISKLRRELTPLTEQEIAFVGHLLDTRFFASHATSEPVFNKDGSIALFSRKKLEGRTIEFNKNHTPQDDLIELRNDDFVFFNLEAGTSPKKRESRFGSKLLRFDFNAPVFKDVAWVSGADLMQIYPPLVQKHINGLDQADIEKLNARYIKDESLVFHGKDMLTGLALSIVRDCRAISDTGRARILSATTEEEINAVVNGMYRPEVKVPRHFFGKPHDVTDIKYAPHKLLP